MPVPSMRGQEHERDLVDDRERRSDTAAATDARADRHLCIVSLDRRTFWELWEFRLSRRHLCRNLYEEHDLKSGVLLEADFENRLL